MYKGLFYRKDVQSLEHIQFKGFSDKSFSAFGDARPFFTRETGLAIARAFQPHVYIYYDADVDAFTYEAELRGDEGEFPQYYPALDHERHGRIYQIGAGWWPWRQVVREGDEGPVELLLRSVEPWK